MRISQIWKVFAVSSCLLTGLQVLGQNFEVSPNDTVELPGSMEDQETLTISFKNLGSSPLVLKWQKISATVPEFWEALVCDNKICYAGLEDSGTMNPVDSSESAFLLLHITSQVNFGTAIVRYMVWDEEDPLLRDTLTYILRVEAPSATRNAVENPYLLLYPNPGNGVLHIITNRPQGFHYQISDMTGKRIISGFSDNSEMICSTVGLIAGLYYISIPDEKDRVTRKFIIGY